MPVFEPTKGSIGFVVALAASLWLTAQALGQLPTDLAGLREVLTQPGPDARLQREAAIDALLSRKEPAAHALLQEFVQRGPDADDLAVTILAQLRRRLANPADAVFGAAERERGLARSYVPTLLALFRDEVERDETRRALRGEARECFAAMAASERRRALDDALKPETALPLRRAALRLAGRSRDLGLAPKLAEHLDSEDLAEAARDSLARLTFCDTLANKKAFEAWWAQASKQTYLQLAEDAARGVRDASAEAQRRADKRSTELLVELIEALSARDDVAWAKLAERAFADDPPGSMRACLGKLRDTLGAVRRHGGVAADRVALLQRVQRQLATGAPSVELRAVLLELCAYLVAPGDDKPAEEVLALLRDGLQHDTVAVRRAAVLGLSRFVQPEATQLLVTAATRAKDAREAELLTAALQSLGASGRTAPDTDAALLGAWLALLEGVLRDEAAPEVQREAALLVLDERGSQGQPLAQAFAVLADVVRSASQSPLIRERAAVMLVPLIGSDDARTEAYVELMVSLLSDGEKRLRLKAAQLLQSPPKQRALVDRCRKRVVEAAGARLVAEADEAVLRALVTCLERQIDTEAPEPGPVVARLKMALGEFAKQGVQGPRRQVLVSALSAQVAIQGIETTAWATAAEVLLDLGERREVRNIIERQRPETLTSRPNTSKDALKMAFSVVVRTAQLKPRQEPWTEREAREVLGALAELRKLDAAPEPAALRLLRLELMVADKRWNEVLDLAGREQADGQLPAAERDRVRLYEARAYLSLGKLPAAVAVADAALQVEPAVLLELKEEVAMAQRRAGQNAEALTRLVEVVQQTPETDANYPRRFLRRIEVEAQLRPEARADLLGRLRERETLFNNPDVPADLRAEFEQLKQRLANGGGKG